VCRTWTTQWGERRLSESGRELTELQGQLVHQSQAVQLGERRVSEWEQKGQ
jgi:hypothetical protein